MAKSQSVTMGEAIKCVLAELSGPRPLYSNNCKGFIEYGHLI